MTFVILYNDLWIATSLLLLNVKATDWLSDKLTLQK